MEGVLVPLGVGVEQGQTFPDLEPVPEREKSMGFNLVEPTIFQDGYAVIHYRVSGIPQQQVGVVAANHKRFWFIFMDSISISLSENGFEVVVSYKTSALDRPVRDFAPEILKL